MVREIGRPSVPQTVHPRVLNLATSMMVPYGVFGIDASLPSQRCTQDSVHMIVIQLNDDVAEYSERKRGKNTRTSF